MTIVALGTTAYVAPKVFAASSFTATNVTLDPASGLVQWNYDSSIDGGGVSGGLSWRIVDTSGNAIWYETTRGTCVSAGGSIVRCSYAVLPVKDDASVTQVRLEASGGSGYTSQTLDYPLPLPKDSQPTHPSASGGWQYDVSNWTYASADAPTFTATASGDLTGVYSPGMRIKLTQSSTIKYFLITGVSYSSPNTTITLYGGTDYSLANSTISKVYISSQKAPHGFPLDPNKWTVELSYASIVSQSNPVGGTWYNLGSLSFSVPIGVWNVEYHIPAYFTGGASTSTAQFTISTSNNSESDADFTSILGGHGGGNAHGATVTKSKALSLTSKTTYYVIEKVDVTGGILTLLGGYSPLKVRAVSVYL